jgi:hypothetical protein
MRGMTSTLLPLLSRPDRTELDALLAPDVAFHSPYADYSGRPDVAHLLAMIPTVVHEIAPTRVVEDDGGRTTFFDASAGDRTLQAVLDERYDSGHLVDATLFIRPYATLRVAMAKMGAALEADPLPSTR